ncbi:MAG TPA: NFACT family protein [Pyrinomonadaceae bacterium]|nr:NFACT family protein [Pyrinomonadaceae bacterium]
MNNSTLQVIINEISPILNGQKFGKIFPLGRLRFVIDFRLNEGNYLFLSLEPFAPRIYLTKAKLRDLEKQSLNPNPFIQMLRKRLSNAVVQSISKDENERIVRLKLLSNDEFEGIKNYTLVIQLTGRSANLFLLDEKDFVLDSLRENQGNGQIIATRYAPPVGEAHTRNLEDTQVFPQGNFETLSEALSYYYQQIEAEKERQNQIKSAEAKLRQEITKREKLQKKLVQDLENHGNAESWKRLGDLLLANLANAVRIDDTVLVTDYFDDSAPTVEIEVAEHLSLTEAAEKFFKRYTKARNAKLALEQRIEQLKTEIAGFEAKKLELEKAVSEQNVSEFLPEKVEEKLNKSKEKQADNIKGARRYISSDGWEILVGKASKDNDFLTFRIAKSLDFWLHAADYGGSHVVVKNPNRSVEIPHKTLLEAAQLAAQFSQAKEQPKVAVNYTQRKFVNKPKGAVAGLVSLSSFKTILVEPKESLERI